MVVTLARLCYTLVAACLTLELVSFSKLRGLLMAHWHSASRSLQLKLLTLVVFIPVSVPWTPEGKQAMELCIPMSENCS